MTTVYPDFFARFYDLIYHQHRDSTDNDFFLNEIFNTNGKVLEVGVGTGRLFTPALSKGADIHGIDISQPMIDVLLKKIEPDQAHRISLQNIIDFNFDVQFDLILAPFRIFMHLTDKADQLRALSNVFRHLKPGGRFIFDTFIPDLGQLVNGLDNVTDFTGEYEPGKMASRTVTTRPDILNQIIQIDFIFEWDEDNMKMKQNWQTQLRYFFRFELEHLIERSEFKDYEILGDYQGNPLNSNSKDFILVCRK